jgi:hypothetical protein
MSIKYVCVYRYETYSPSLVSEYPENLNFKNKETIVTILNTIPPKEYRRQTIEDNDINYTYLNNKEYVAVCITDKSCKCRTIQNFLEDISNNITINSINERLLKDKMKYHNDPNNDKIAQIQINIDNAKNIMTNNIEKALDRQDQLDNMQSKSNTLAESANQFDSNANDLKRAFWWKNIKSTCMICFILFVVISIIVLLSCGGDLSKCK